MIIDKNYFLQSTQSEFEVTIYEHGHALTGTDWQASLVNPPFSRLYFICGGDGYYTLGGDSFPLKEGFCYLFPRGISFSHGCKISMEQVFFHISLTASSGYDLLTGLTAPLFCKFNFEELLSCINSHNPNSVLKTKSIILNCLFSLFSQANIQLYSKEYSPCVAIALSKIHALPNIKLSLTKLAEGAFVSQTTLSKRFKAEVGTTVSAYIDDVVFAKAQLLLKTAELSIGDISEALGFCDQFYFSRRFSQRYAESPASYRRKVQM